MIELFHTASGAGVAATQWAALVGDGMLLGFSPGATDDLACAGEIHVGVLRTVDNARGLGFVLLAGGQEAMLDLPRGGAKLQEGVRMPVQVRRPARGAKLAKVSMRIVLEGRTASLVLSESLEQIQIEPRDGSKTGTIPSAESDRLTRMAVTIRAAAAQASGPARIWRGRNCVADLLFRFPDALPAAVRSDTRNAAEELRRSLGDDPIGLGVDVEHVPARDWRYAPAELRDMIDEAFEPRHALPSGGSLLVERGETMTVIDVNSGSADASSGPERVAIKTNKEAAAAIARGVRFLNLAGNIVIDFVGVRARGQQRTLVDSLRAGFECDPARPWIGTMSPIGLVEMSRRVLGHGPVKRLKAGDGGRP